MPLTAAEQTLESMTAAQQSESDGKGGFRFNHGFRGWLGWEKKCQGRASLFLDATQ
jgi:hypothetical protein